MMILSITKVISDASGFRNGGDRVTPFATPGVSKRNTG
jgi:hypothetical protein